MNKATLQRFYHDKVTFGRLTFDWLPKLPIIYTLELPWLNNRNKISCIPQGLYNVTTHNSLDHPDTFEILCVPGRKNILLHIGNYACDVPLGKKIHKSDTQGCVLVGLGYDKTVPMLKRSADAMNILRDSIPGNWCVEVRNFLPPE